MTDTRRAGADVTPAAPGIAFPFDNSFARELPGFYVARRPNEVRAPRLLFLNAPLVHALGLNLDAVDDAGKAAIFSGNALPEGAEPIAQAYAGHQFGGFSPQLGDGRALLVGEVIGRDGQRYDIAFKGSGRTVFARGGDGKAAVGPMLREVLIGEAMHALGIPTTRALAVVATGEDVYREAALPGAVLARVAASHLRVGTFQYFAARGDVEGLRRLLDYTLTRHDPALRDAPERAPALLRAVAQRQARLIAQWMNVGFIHGVMNTDNMALSGETIDYGPCAFIEAYDPAAVFSSIDHGGRYAYGNQPLIARWNLARFAETLSAVVLGSALTAAAQGVLGGVAYWALGVPFSVLLAGATAFLSLLPYGGPLVWIGVAAYLALTGDYIRASIMAGWGALAISSADNIIRPLVIGGRTQIPTVFLFFGILGGLQAYGFLGMFLGPAVIAILVAFARIYREQYADERPAKPSAPA